MNDSLREVFDSLVIHWYGKQSYANYLEYLTKIDAILRHHNAQFSVSANHETIIIFYEDSGYAAFVLSATAINGACEVEQCPIA